MADHEAALPADLVALAKAAGVHTSYVDHGRKRRHARREPLVAVLEAFGHADARDDPGRALERIQARDRARPIDPVTVVVAGRRPTVGIRHCDDATVRCELVAEDGSRREWDAPTRASRGIGHVAVRRVPIPADVEVGYYELTVRSSGGAATTNLFVRPARGTSGRFGATWRATGIAAPLFTLYRPDGWGCGDLADLDHLGELAATSGVTVVATLPLLAGLEPPHFDPSPYLPISRSYWHERWIDLDGVLRDVGVPATAGVVQEARAAALEAAATSHPYVDGAASLLAKRRVLESVLAASSGTRLGDDLDAFLLDRPEVASFARFLAECERRGPNWWNWPALARDGTLGEQPDDALRRYHGLVQLLMGRQLDALATRLDARGQVLALDLPLGVHPWAYDVWRHRAQFVPALSIGAPPDRFFPAGQRWGMPFPRIDEVRTSGHSLFRAALRHHLSVARLLRIDHILGLQRLFCIPEGGTASDGVYVACPLDELLAVVAIEAYRSRAEIVGEDLGTVDSHVRRAMLREGFRRSFVVELAVRRRGEPVLREPPPGSNASFTTHDLATFAGWWAGRDVDERLATGQIDAGTAAIMRAARHAERDRLSTLVPQLAVRDDAAPSDVLDATLEALGRSDAGIVVAQLDDLAGELDAVNLPGTSTERPNWQRRLRVPLEELAGDGRVAASLSSLDVARASTAPDPGRRRVGDVLTQRVAPSMHDEELELFRSGRHARLYDVLGAHPTELHGVRGTRFSVWAPRAAWVEVVGDFNGFDGRRHPLYPQGDSGIFEAFAPGVGPGYRYRFRLAQRGGRPVEKADPFAARTELPGSWSSVVGGVGYEFGDGAWMAGRAQRQGVDRPISIYELHLGSWRRVVEEGRRPMTYREAAPRIVEHVVRQGFTHVELLPVMEHPLYASWGYQTTSYFAPTARYGTPEEFCSLVDALHQAGIGVVLDWVPAHFPSDELGLARFDGAALFEHADPRRSVHPEWRSLIFDYGRGEVRSFLLSAAASWLDRYHADGLRFDAVASMLYLDYARGPGEWEPNAEGGREDLDAVRFLQDCNEVLHEAHPGVLTMAEESTAWPGVTSPTDHGGLGFDYKWDLGWMHDTLHYLAEAPEHRRFHHDLITFRSIYSASEQFVLPLSHDEVVHGKGSLLGRMPGDVADRFANLRLLYGLQLLQPGKKLLFMGDEIGQLREWAHDHSVDWHLEAEPRHAGIAALVAALNELYREHPALHRDDLADRGFRWLHADDAAQSCFSVERHDDADDLLVVVLNAGPEDLGGYDVEVSRPGPWRLALSSDDARFGGRGAELPAVVVAGDRLACSVPALGFVVYRHGDDAPGSQGSSGRFASP